MTANRNESMACLLHEVNHLMLEHKSKALKKFGITFPQMLVLGYLFENETQNVSQTMICRRMHLKGSSVTSLIGNMIKNGLVIKNDNPLDGRGQIVSLTEKGKGIASKIKDVFIYIDNKTVSVLNAEEVETMKRLLLKIRMECENEKQEKQLYV